MARQLAHGATATVAERIRELKETPIIHSRKDESNVEHEARELYSHHEP